MILSQRAVTSARISIAVSLGTRFGRTPILAVTSSSETGGTDRFYGEGGSTKAALLPLIHSPTSLCSDLRCLLYGDGSPAATVGTLVTCG